MSCYLIHAAMTDRARKRMTVTRSQRNFAQQLVVCIVIERVLRQLFLYFFFFQAEDGIRDYKVTGVQTCALPISQQGKIIFLLRKWNKKHCKMFLPGGPSMWEDVGHFPAQNFRLACCIYCGPMRDRKSVV